MEPLEVTHAKIEEIERLKAELCEYLTRANVATSQPSKEIIFASFAEKIFGIKLEDFSEKMWVGDEKVSNRHGKK